ncbi:MAG: hypothetical protein Q8M31_21855 [Beijerinckiaceae bacterium]|nr:hypothetical protein [Beijerinckiaceae bacterium]
MAPKLRLVSDNPLPKSPGGRSSPRVPALESQPTRADIAEVKEDGRDHRKATDRGFRILFGALIVAALGLAGLMAKGFGWL